MSNSQFAILNFNFAIAHTRQLQIGNCKLQNWLSLMRSLDV